MTETKTLRRDGPTADHPEVRVVAGARHRLTGVLDHGVDDPPDDPTIDEVVAAAAGHTGAHSWMIAGGEPTLRSDFPHLVRALSRAGAPRLGMVTDGLALAARKVPGMLQQLGLERVRIRLAGARADAHDYLVGQEGAWKRTVKAVRTCVEAGLVVEIECPITRPTRPQLHESVELFARLGASAVLLRRVTARGPTREHDVAVLARLGLLQRDVETAVQAGVRSGLRVMVEGLPVCAAPGIGDHHLPTDAVVWALPSKGSWAFMASRFELPSSEPGCGRCEGRPVCCQAPTDYLRRFGRTEIDSESNTPVRIGRLPPTPLAGGDVRPPARAGRYPASHVAYAQRAARLPSLSGDPLVLVRARHTADVYRTLFLAPSKVSDASLGDHPGPSEPETTRDVRIRLVKLAQHGVQTLRVASAGTLAHPQAAELLRETTRLEFPRIEVAGEGSAINAMTDMQLRRLRGITRVDLALYGPDAESHDAVVGEQGAFDATLGALDRLSTLVPSMRVGVYAVLRDPSELAAFAEAWDFGDLPGDPFFRLGSGGGDLRALADAAGKLPEGPARDAIAAVLPVALFPRGDVLPAPEAQLAWGDIPSAYASPSGSDRYGCYTDRPSRSSEPQPGDCPGYAVGWTAS